MTVQDREDGQRIGWHPLDPPGPHRAASLLGQLVASGMMPRDWALQALLGAAERLRPPHASATGLRMRLAHRLDDAVRDHERLRARATTDVRRAVLAPILARRPKAELLALAAGADPDEALRPRERLALIETEVAWALRTGALRTGVPCAG